VAVLFQTGGNAGGLKTSAEGWRHRKILSWMLL
jgi:hypothetical protein